MSEKSVSQPVVGAQKIIPCLWFDQGAAEAAAWYAGLFEDSVVYDVDVIRDTPSGDTETVSFRLAGLELAAIGAGSSFAFNAAASLLVSCPSPEEVDRLYAALSPGGSVHMPLGSYPFSGHYAWIRDRFGLHWQLMHVPNGPGKHAIRPCLRFASEACGRAEEALAWYETVFPDSRRGTCEAYGTDEMPDPRAKTRHAELLAGGLPFVLADHGAGDGDVFNEALSFMISCAGQKEMDFYMDRLSHVPDAEQCGWLKDRFGVSWQVVPDNLGELLSGTDAESAAVMEALLSMRRLDLAAMEAAKRAVHGTMG